MDSTAETGQNVCNPERGVTTVARGHSSASVPIKRATSTDLMSPPLDTRKKLKRSRCTRTVTTQLALALPGRNDLGLYLSSPDNSPLFLYQTPFAVAINDMYPKSSIHTLLLPRDPLRSAQHPFLALANSDFLDEVKKGAETLIQLVASKLCQKYGAFSALEIARQEAMALAESANIEMPDLPPGRDWKKDVLVGVHARPSMKHLHVHVVSVDRFSTFLRHRKHYNSFSTDFFVRLDEFPLSQNDVRRNRDCGGYLGQDLVCWRCGKGFGKKFAAFKLHLADEYQNWKKE